MYKKIIYLLVFIFIYLIVSDIIHFLKPKDRKLAETRRLMREHRDDLFYICKDIDNSKYFYSLQDFPKLEIMEKSCDIIRKELRKVIKDFESPGVLFPQDDLQNTWKNFWLMNGNNWHPENIKKCPQTYQLLKKIGAKREALFALLKPGSEIKPHKGTGNYVIRCQMPLLNIPNNSSSGIQCGEGPYKGEKRFHYQDKLLIFDDSNWHGAWNKSNLDRIVLIFDVINPSIDKVKYQNCFNEHIYKMHNVMKKMKHLLPQNIN